MKPGEIKLVNLGDGVFSVKTSEEEYDITPHFLAGAMVEFVSGVRELSDGLYTLRSLFNSHNKVLDETLTRGMCVLVGGLNCKIEELLLEYRNEFEVLNAMAKVINLP